MLVAGKKNEENLDSVILKYITKTPGVHFNDLQRALDLAPGTLQYHLNRMEKGGKVIVVRKEYKTLYFPISIRDPTDQKIIILLRQRIPRTLLLILLEHTEKTGHELKDSLKITKSTLSYYTRHLEKEKRFSVSEPERVAKLLSEHKKSFGDEMVDRFVDLWVRI
jgi:predicted transcriptional regulator